MANVFIEARPKGRPEGSPITDYVIEDGEGQVINVQTIQRHAVLWAKKRGFHPLIARVRHLNDKSIPDHWRSTE